MVGKFVMNFSTSSSLFLSLHCFHVVVCLSSSPCCNMFVLRLSLVESATQKNIQTIDQLPWMIYDFLINYIIPKYYAINRNDVSPWGRWIVFPKGINNDVLKSWFVGKLLTRREKKSLESFLPLPCLKKPTMEEKKNAKRRNVEKNQISIVKFSGPLLIAHKFF
jgi:hypothetical protein